MHTYALSCRSATLAKAFPSISNLTSIIPHFVQEEHCDGVCSPGTPIWKEIASFKHPGNFRC